MINKADLSEGSWYDGFLWVAGKQRGTATLRWHGDYFSDGLESRVVSYKSQHGEGFEPNVISIGEPAG